MKIKLLDFGFSKRLKSLSDLSYEYCGTPTFLSPEVWNKKPYSPLKSDIWALGVVLYKLLCNKYPFEGDDKTQLFVRINKCNYDIDKKISTGAEFLLNKMLRKDPEMRYTAEEILNDSWVLSAAPITGKSYFSGCNSKWLDSRDLISRNKKSTFDKRPSTSANAGFKSATRKPIFVASTDKIPIYTQYKGFGNFPQISSRDSEALDDKSVSVR